MRADPKRRAEISTTTLVRRSVKVRRMATAAMRRRRPG